MIGIVLNALMNGSSRDLGGFLLLGGGNEQPRGRVARLAGVVHASFDRPWDHAAQVRIVENNKRRLSSQLLSHPLDCIRRELRQVDAPATFPHTVEKRWP